MNKKYYVLTGRTESGDRLRTMLFSNRPTNERIEELLRGSYPVEYEEVGFVNWSIDETYLIDE